MFSLSPFPLFDTNALSFSRSTQLVLGPRFVREITHTAPSLLAFPALREKEEEGGVKKSASLPPPPICQRPSEIEIYICTKREREI